MAIPGRWRFSERSPIKNDPVVLKDAAKKVEMGFSFDLVVVPGQLPDVAGLAATMPGLAIIVGHLATPEPVSQSSWISGVKALRRFDNVAMREGLIRSQRLPHVATPDQRA